jgi:hypothetical protein
MTLTISLYAAAKGRVQGPATPLWHAVELHRPASELDGACELTVCGSLGRISTDDRWPVASPDMCSVCAALTAH